MAQLVVSVQELMQNYIDMADDWSLDIKISDELLQLTRVVIKKQISKLTIAICYYIIKTCHTCKTAYFSCQDPSFCRIKVPITPKNVFYLVQSLYGIRKNVTKIFAFG